MVEINLSKVRELFILDSQQKEIRSKYQKIDKKGE
jgi:hypothetical protein